MDLTESARRLDVPTLVLTGSRDRLTTPALAARLLTLIKGSRLRIMEGAGHMLPLEAPRWVNREISTFVASLDGPPASAAGVGGARRFLLRHVLDRLSRLARRRSGEMF